jgi:integrase
MWTPPGLLALAVLVYLADRKHDRHDRQRTVNEFHQSQGFSPCRAFILTQGPHVTFHGLRHTHATLLIAAGVDIRTVAHRLGHTSVQVTGDTYAHAMAATDENAASVLAERLQG